MGPGGSPGDAQNRAPRIHIPVGRSETGECGDHIHTVRVFYAQSDLPALNSALDKPETVSEPLHHSACNEDRAFQGIAGPSSFVAGEGEDEAVFRLDFPGSCVQQQEAAGAVGVFRFAFKKAALAEQCRLLVTSDAGNGYLPTEDGWVGGTHDSRRVHDIGQDGGGDVQEFEQVLVPAFVMDVEDKSPRCVCIVGGMDFSHGELGDEPGIDGAECDLACARPGHQSGYVVKEPFYLGSGKVGVDDQPGLLLEEGTVSSVLQFVADGGASPALPYDGVMNGFEGVALP